MPSISSSKLLATALCAILSFTNLSLVAAAPAPIPVPQASTTEAAATSSNDSPDYWLGQATFHNKRVPWGQSDSNYKLYRNVKDYGATGDGSTDDTNAILNAMFDGDRCTTDCNSSTTSPAIVYFPSGTYMVHSPIEMPYYTQMIGDANALPTIAATANFSGMAVVDADPYGLYGVNWFINQNNFFRQVRNFVIDITGISGETGACIHWQVAQATSLQNIVFNMKKGTASQQQGIFMDNGSGGWMGDLIFNGGKYGAFFGNQQFTSSNMTFNDCQTAIFMNWNWGWTLTGITINGPGGNSTGLDMSNSPTNQTVGSVILADSSITGVMYGVRSAYSLTGNVPATGGTLVIDNVNFQGTTGPYIADVNGGTILSGNAHVTNWASGNVYDHSSTGQKTQATLSKTTTKAAGLLDSNGNIFRRFKPQYEGSSDSDFMRAIGNGTCAGDATTDDTQCIQTFLNNAAKAGKIAYFEHAVYRVTNTVQVPPGSKIVGECWSTILATNFTNGTIDKPTPVFQIGTPGQSGSVEMSDMLFEIQGVNEQAIMVQWDLSSTQGESGMWDSHIRMGGSYGSNMLYGDCAKQPGNSAVEKNCIAGFMMFYASPQSSNVYLENTWFWTADHDMEDPLNRQISVYNGRGMLIKSQGPVHLWGTSCEHSVIYNYQFDGVQALYSGFMQSETPYMQPYPMVPTPFSFNSAYDDPTFTICGTNPSVNEPCDDAWGLRMVNSKGVLIYGTGLYSFFNGYTQDCLAGESCQLNMIRVQGTQATIYAGTTKASVNMIRDDYGGGNGITVTGAANRGVYGDTFAVYYTG